MVIVLVFFFYGCGGGDGCSGGGGCDALFVGSCVGGGQARKISKVYTGRDFTQQYVKCNKRNEQKKPIQM